MKPGGHTDCRNAVTLPPHKSGRFSGCRLRRRRGSILLCRAGPRSPLRDRGGWFGYDGQCRATSRTLPAWLWSSARARILVPVRSAAALRVRSLAARPARAGTRSSRPGAAAEGKATCTGLLAEFGSKPQKPDTTELTRPQRDPGSATYLHRSPQYTAPAASGRPATGECGAGLEPLDPASPPAPAFT